MLINSIKFVQSTPASVKLPINASWNQNAITVAGQANGNSGGSTNYLNYPSDLCISDDNILYISDEYNNRVVMVDLTTSTVIKTIGSGQGSTMNKFWNPNGIFLSGASIYVVDTNNSRIQKWSINGTNPKTVPGNGAFGLSFYMFIDKYGNTYVSSYTLHEVISFAPNSSVPVIVAGDGTVGSQSYRLNRPYGIFVDDNLTLYIADFSNHRIQMWISGASSGNTVAGTGTSGYSLQQLSKPNAVVVDTNGYMYIADSNNNRILRWLPYSTTGYCIVACTNNYGIDMNYLNYPTAVAFDSNGSLYVADYDNNRVQKFQIIKNQSQTPTTIQIAAITTQFPSTTTTTTTTTTTANAVTTEIITTTTTTTTTANAVTKEIITTTTTTTTTANAVTTAITTTTTTTTEILTTEKLSTAIPSTLLTTKIQSILTSTKNLINPTTSLQSIDTSQMSSTVDQIHTSKSSIISSTIKQSSTTSTTTLSSSFIISTMYSTTNDQQTTQNPNIMSTKLQSTFLPQISKSSMSQTTQPLTTINQFECSNAIIFLSPTNPSITTPLEIERSQDFSISSTLQFQCLHSFGVIQQWSISKCLNSLCSLKQQLEYSSPDMTLGELYIPSNILDYGIYEMKLIVTMSISSQLISSKITYVQIIPSPIQVKLIQFGPSIILHGQQQTLILNPGIYSIDPDQDYFNSTNWNYTYYCQIYNNEIVSNLNQTMLSIDDINYNSSPSSCFRNSTINETLWKYGSNSPRSSLIVSNGSFQSNQTYYFKVKLNNILNPSIIYSGNLLLQIEDQVLMTIIIKCIITTQCISINEYQLINPTTQISLNSFCIDNCSYLLSNKNIEWNIYYGIENLTNYFIQWNLFENKIQYINNGIFGLYSNNFTMTKDILLSYSNIKYWRFEVIYSFQSIQNIGLINFIINSPPKNGTCSIYPLNGTITTLFTINCSNWFDENGIKDYSFYTWTSDRSNILMLGYTTSEIFQVRMPINNLNSSLINLLVRVRDIYDCTTELDLSSVTIITDTNNILSLMQRIQSAVTSSDYSNIINSNSLINILYGGNQNDINQVLTSLSQILNNLVQQNFQLAIDNNISPLIILVSTLDQNSSIINNQSQTFTLTEYNQQLNTLAAVNEYLMTFINNLTIGQMNSVILQASTLSQLTAMTNQLTRNSLIIASTRCHDLSLVLSNNAEMISYEDVQIISNYISQCMSNVLTAVNAPLQQRTIVLDLDTTRANALPADYDTDLELVWSNLNLFADGDDFSEETIEKNRNIYYQKQTAAIINKQFDETMLLITNALNAHLNMEQNISINTSSIIMSLKRLYVDSMSNQFIDLNDKTQIWLPENLQFNSTKNSTISLRCIQTPLSIAGNVEQTNINLSNLVLVSFINENGEEVQVNTSNSNPIEFFIPRDNNLIVPPMTIQNVSSIINNDQFNLHFINITQINKNISLSVHFEMYPLDNSLGYMLIYKFDGIPQLNSSIQQIDDWTMLCPRNLTSDNLLTYFIDNEKTVGHQTIIFGIRELNSTEFDMYCINTSTNILITDQYCNFSSDYELRIFTSGCYYLDLNNNWQSNGLLVGSLTNHDRTQCFSNHLTSFASGYFVLPLPINWNYVFANAEFLKNKTLYITVIIIIIIFLFIAIYARHLDNKDNQKLEVTTLSDNQSNDKYLYQMIIFTGIWKNAGTSAKVKFILSGDNYETNARNLTNPHRKLFQRGSIDSFVFGVSKSLGLLNYLRIWHDNSGPDSLSSSWFLKYVIVRDLQTMKKFYFISQKWLSLNKGDGKIDRVFPVSNDDQMREFVYPISEKAYFKLSEGHLWFSIFSQPPATKFTRVQRCICCFVLLFTVMLLSILYYDQSNEANAETRVGGFLFGPFYFSPQQIGIGIITDILIFIPSTFLVAFFRRIQNRRFSKQNSSINRTIEKLRSSQAFQPISNNTTTIIHETKQKKKKKKIRILFPWWCLFIAYGLSFILISVSIFLIIARGIQFGELKVQKWLASLITAFISSVFLSQPVKVLFIAIFLAVMQQRPSDDDDDDEESNKCIDENEEFYLNGGAEHIQSIEENDSKTDRRLMRINYLNKAKANERRKIRLREYQMWSYIRHVIFYSCFICILYVVSYTNRNPYAYQEVHHLRQFFLNPNNSTYNYMKISTIDDYWKWLEDSFVENIRAQPWYNGDPPEYLSGFINDKANRLIGWPVMRQLRIKPNFTCRVPIAIRPKIPKCYGDYSLSNEDRQSWFPGWQSTSDNISYSQSIINAFIYQPGSKLDSYKYRGILNTYDDGGYVYEFRGRLNEMQDNLTILHNLSWIDAQTRAIIIQLTLYNTNVQLYTSVTFLIEFMSTSGAFTQAHFQPIDLHAEFQGFSSILHGIFAVIYMLFIVYFTFIEINSLIKLKKKYFHSIWSFLQWGIILSSWAGFGVYIWRFEESSHLNKLFYKTNGYNYVNIQMAVDVDEILMFLFGFCCFFSTIKYLYLFRFNSRLSQFAKTLEYVKKDLLYFALTFFLVFISFICLFYLLFYSKILSCSDVYRTAEMLFEMLLLKFNSQDLYEADIFLGPLVFSLFIYFLVFICCTMIISIINGGFRHIRYISKKQSNQDEHQDVLLFVFMKMKRVLGMKQNNLLECQQNKNSLEQLSDKIDKLVITLNELNIISSNETQLTTASSLRKSDVFVEDV